MTSISTRPASESLPAMPYPLWARTYPPRSSYGPRPPLRVRGAHPTLSHTQPGATQICRDRSPVGQNYTYESIDDRMTRNSCSHTRPGHISHAHVKRRHIGRSHPSRMNECNDQTDKRTNCLTWRDPTIMSVGGCADGLTDEGVGERFGKNACWHMRCGTFAAAREKERSLRMLYTTTTNEWAAAG
jgi:hypothetical protein